MDWFDASFILRVFANHLNSTVEAEEVHDFEVAGDYEDLDQAASISRLKRSHHRGHQGCAPGYLSPC